ncbi:pentatricopeptide repeat-containing protein At1g11290, chloroplastic-like [Phalaenopsis equestris]|uniref:pentatricopeptide repeat-containing protein At1g11290, chloroplastic-like n=1 Tax=Phalaenopsis equestris TaxID=78828 RepID=UPI0009E3B16C|nr:pentatricopeptide repeat-containing protein At1g11290, chloroplastic-like [Phalaenopsis equestris]
MLRLFSSSTLLPRLLLLLPAQQASAASIPLVIHVDSAPQQPNSLLPASPYTFVKLLSGAVNSCSIYTGEQYHSAIIKLGFLSNVFVTTVLLDLYCKGGNFTIAQQLFDEMPHQNVVTWNTLIHGLSLSDRPNDAIEVFYEMMVEGISPTSFTFSTVLATFSHLRDLTAGILMHCIGLRHGFLSNVVVGTALVNMYCKCSDLTAAKKAFDEMPQPNVVTWTSLVTGYAHHQRPIDAMLLVVEMRQLGFLMNKMTYNSLLSSFWRFSDLDHGRQVHSIVIKEGLDCDPYITVSLVTMYSKCGSSVDFMNVCLSVSDWDQVSFNSIITGFSHLADGWEVLARFVEMRKAGLDTDIFTFMSILRAVSIVSAFREGRQAHALILKCSHDSNLSIQNGLVTMYAKCGDINDSKEIFFSMDSPDLISWNSLLSGCAEHGYGEEAIEMFEEMRRIGVKPDGTTYLSVLSACSHVGLVKKGMEFFHLMLEADSMIVAGMEHYACVVDLLGRAGFLNEAYVFVTRMQINPGVSVYRALLSACQVHGNVEMAKYAAKCLLELCPNDSGAHVLLSNVFAADESWHNAAGIREVMEGKSVRKRPAWSWIEEGNVAVQPSVKLVADVL